MSRTKFFFKVFFTTLLLGAVIGFGFAACNFIGMTTFDAEFDINDFTLSHTTMVVITDENGTEHEWFKMHTEENRQIVSMSDIPQAMKDAVICIEDERFYYHNGVDFVGTAKAVLNYAAGKKNAPGGSTITQQLVKNLTNDRDVSWRRKVEEILRAMNVENNASKEEILEMYLNTVYFGNGAYGVKAAAKLYFDKDPRDLTVLECASIAGLTQNPGGYNPYDPDRKEAFTNRRNSVLKKMLEFDKITQEEYDSYINTETEFVPREESKSDASSKYPYFEQKLTEDLKSDLMETYDMSEDEAWDYLLTGGLKVYSTLDPNVQNAINAVYQAETGSPDSPQSAIVIIDPYTGAIKGMAGGFGEGRDVRNRVYDDPRQPGSAIKPLAVYAPALEMDVINPATPVEDTALEIKKGHIIKNYDNEYLGVISAKKALQLSRNPTAMRVLQDVGLNTSFNYLKDNFGITTLAEADKDYSPLALGGLTNGVRIDELAAAYAPFVNGGNYYAPYTYTHVVDSHGNVILDNRDKKPKRAMSESTAFVVNSLLQSVVVSPISIASSAKISGVATGGKTGTTDDDTNRWFVGITPHYTGAVWYGYDDHSKTVYASGNPSVRLWRSVMDKVYSTASADKKNDRFYDGKVPGGVKIYSICSTSGYLATADCSAVTGYFKSGNPPKDYCDEHSTEPEPEDEDNPENQDGDEPADGDDENSSSDENNENNEDDEPEENPPSDSDNSSETQPSDE